VAADHATRSTDTASPGTTTRTSVSFASTVPPRHTHIVSELSIGKNAAMLRTVSKPERSSHDGAACVGHGDAHASGRFTRIVSCFDRSEGSDGLPFTYGYATMCFSTPFSRRRWRVALAIVAYRHLERQNASGFALPSPERRPPSVVLRSTL